MHHSIILGRLSITLAVIDYRSRQMMRFNGTHQFLPLVLFRDQNLKTVHVSATFYSSEGRREHCILDGHHSLIDGRLNQYKAIRFEWDPERLDLWIENYISFKLWYPTNPNASRLSHNIDSPILLLMQCSSQPR